MQTAPTQSCFLNESAQHTLYLLLYREVFVIGKLRGSQCAGETYNRKAEKETLQVGDTTGKFRRRCAVLHARKTDGRKAKNEDMRQTGGKLRRGQCRRDRQWQS